MSIIPEDLIYTKDHSWVRIVEEFEVVYGITDHAQEILGNIVFIELPYEGMEVNQGEQVVLVESIIDITDLYSPLSGWIIGVNRLLEEKPGLINNDPYGEGWILKIDIKSMIELGALLNYESYREYIEEW